MKQTFPYKENLAFAKPLGGRFICHHDTIAIRGGV
jgi:hypothetical protein